MGKFQQEKHYSSKYVIEKDTVTGCPYFLFRFHVLV